MRALNEKVSSVQLSQLAVELTSTKDTPSLKDKFINGTMIVKEEKEE